MRSEIVHRKPEPEVAPQTEVERLAKLENALHKNHQELDKRYSNCSCSCDGRTGRTGSVDHCELSVCLNGRGTA